jgi:hypothetical protein
MVGGDLGSLLDLYRDDEMIGVGVLSLFTLDEIFLTGSQVVPSGNGLTIVNIFPVPIVSVVLITSTFHDSGEVGHVVVEVHLQLASIVTRHIESISRGDWGNEITSHSVGQKASWKSIGSLEIHGERIVVLLSIKLVPIMHPISGVVEASSQTVRTRIMTG